MKKSIFLILLLLAMLFEVSALGEYGIQEDCFNYYESESGGGYVGAMPWGSELTLDKVHNNRWQSALFSGKKELKILEEHFSERQIFLISSALRDWCCEPGEIYSVGFFEESDTNHYYAITCQINSDGTFNWRGFSCYEQYNNK